MRVRGEEGGDSGAGRRRGSMAREGPKKGRGSDSDCRVGTVAGDRRLPPRAKSATRYRLLRATRACHGRPDPDFFKCPALPVSSF